MRKSFGIAKSDGRDRSFSCHLSYSLDNKRLPCGLFAPSFKSGIFFFLRSFSANWAFKLIIRPFLGWKSFRDFSIDCCLSICLGSDSVGLCYQRQWASCCMYLSSGSPVYKWVNLLNRKLIFDCFNLELFTFSRGMESAARTNSSLWIIASSSPWT